jgi:hypothetical protein
MLVAAHDTQGAISRQHVFEDTMDKSIREWAFRVAWRHNMNTQQA